MNLNFIFGLNFAWTFRSKTNFNLHPSFWLLSIIRFLKIYYLFSFTKKILLENSFSLAIACEQNEKKSYFSTEKQKVFFLQQMALGYVVVLFEHSHLYFINFNSFICLNNTKNETIINNWKRGKWKKNFCI